MSTATPVRTDARALITEGLFGRLVDRIVKDEQITELLAERIVTDALAFLAACGANQGSTLAPSEQVDIGWHTFLMYTEEYADFCSRVAGRFIHHSPADLPGVSYEPKATTRLRSMAAMRALGYEPFPGLWGSTAECSQCHDGCSNSNYAGK
ncbi:glycine-rich domain-containing protein [Streptomyces sp. NPDC059080]|uniref:glycine-rich domain-containing protein n=1 Tax=Streptomyces sp. NPDC059080 TaxID=3346718 RepID=UPI00369FB48B